MLSSERFTGESAYLEHGADPCLGPRYPNGSSRRILLSNITVSAGMI